MNDTTPPNDTEAQNPLHFTAILQLHGKTATGIEVPAAIVAALGSGKRPAVNATINGYTYRSTVAPMGGVFMVPVSAEIRAGAGVATGDDIQVELTLDTAPREVAVPADLAAALDAAPAARQAFDALSYSNKRAHVLSVEGAKTPETRQRRIVKAVETLQGRCFAIACRVAHPPPSPLARPHGLATTAPHPRRGKESLLPVFVKRRSKPRGALLGRRAHSPISTQTMNGVTTVHTLPVHAYSIRDSASAVY